MRAAPALIVLLVITFAQFSRAAFTLIDDTSGKKYRCTEVASLGASEPDCIEKLRSYCRANSSYSPNECFDKATKACGLGTAVKDCVPKSAAACRSGTSYGSKECFDRALTGCGAL